MIDWAEIEDRLLDSAERGMQATGKQMLARAQHLAPVRKVFQNQRNITKAAARKAQWRSATTNRFVSHRMPVGDEDDVQMLHRHNQPFSPNTRIRNRPAGPSRVIEEERGGTVPGSQLAFRKNGAFYKSRVTAFQKFSLQNEAGKTLNVRGRYELQSGRAFFKQANGQTTLGGRLRASIVLDDMEYTDHGMGLRLNAGGEAAYYAIYQELGTRHHPAHPFLRPALDEARKYYRYYIERSLKATRL
jgi:HK97 gp10 family phage protein